MGELLRISDLSVSYLVNDLQILAVDGVSLDIGEGEIVGLVGESGSGKSTLANTIMRTIRPPAFVSGGEILFKGKDLLRMGKEEMRDVLWKQISLVPQASQNALSPTKRIRDHFVDTMRAHGVNDRRVIEETANHYLEEVLLEPKRVMDAYPIELSGGMKQRVRDRVEPCSRPSPGGLRRTDFGAGCDNSVDSPRTHQRSSKEDEDLHAVHNARHIDSRRIRGAGGGDVFRQGDGAGKDRRDTPCGV